MTDWLTTHMREKMRRTRTIGARARKSEVPIKGTSKVYELFLTPELSELETIVDCPNGTCHLWNPAGQVWEAYDLQGVPR